MNDLILQGSALVVAVNLFTSLTKTYIVPRWGKTGVQVIVAFFALLAALYLTYQEFIPGLKVFLATSVAIFSLAVSLYEVLWSKLSPIKE